LAIGTRSLSLTRALEQILLYFEQYNIIESNYIIYVPAFDTSTWREANTLFGFCGNVNSFSLMQFQYVMKLKVMLSFALIRICSVPLHDQLNNQSICFACVHKSIFHAEKSFVEITLRHRTKLHSRILKLLFLLCKELVYFPLMWKYWRDLARVFAVDIKFFVRTFFSWCSIGVNLFEMSFGVSTAAVFQANSENDFAPNTSIQDFMCAYTYLLGREWG